MNFPNKFAEQFSFEKQKINSQNIKFWEPTYNEAAIICQNCGFHTKYNYKYAGPYANKTIDVALFNDTDRLIGAIFFKYFRHNVNDTANKNFEIIRGESQLFIDDDLPIYQIVAAPTKIFNSNDRMELPNDLMINNYQNYISYYKPKGLELGLYYFDIDYINYTGTYSNKYVINGIPERIGLGIRRFVEKLT